jgi:hypothetical protein
MSDKYDRNNAEHAHFRVDQLEKDMKIILKSMARSEENTKKSSENLSMIKWTCIGGLLVFTGNTVGIFNVIKVAL